MGSALTARRDGTLTVWQDDTQTPRPPSAFLLLLRLRLRGLANGISAAPPAHKWIGGILSAGSGLLFLTILIAFDALLDRAQPLAIRDALIAETVLYLFTFLLAGAIPFVSGVLFTPGDLVLLAGAPVRPVDLVGARLVDATIAASAQFLVIGVPLLIAIGVALHFGFVAWLGFAFLLLLFLALPSLLISALLLLLARIVGLRHVRAAVALASVALSVGLCLMLVSTLSSQSGKSGGLFHAATSNATLAAAHTETLLPAYLPSTYMTRSLRALGHVQGATTADALLPTALLTVLVILATLACLGLGGPILTGERLLEGDGGGSAGDASAGLDRVLSALPLSAPVRALIGRDLRFVARDLVLLSQLGIPLILFLVPFAISGQMQSMAGPDTASDLATLTLGTIGTIAFMETSILGLSSIGLEGQAFWLVLTAPVTASRLVTAKWLGATGVSLVVTVPLLLLTALLYHLPPVLTGASFALLLVACAALCGLGVGISGLFPRFVFENPAHRASIAALIWGFVTSTGYVLIAGAPLGLAIYYAAQTPELAGRLWATGVGWFLFVSLLTGAIPLWLARVRLRGMAWEM